MVRLSVSVSLILDNSSPYEKIKSTPTNIFTQSPDLSFDTEIALNLVWTFLFAKSFSLRTVSETLGEERSGYVGSKHVYLVICKTWYSTLVVSLYILTGALINLSASLSNLEK